jgi:FixJ family two-component response regulator
MVTANKGPSECLTHNWAAIFSKYDILRKREKKVHDQLIKCRTRKSRAADRRIRSASRLWQRRHFQKEEENRNLRARFLKEHLKISRMTLR